MSGYGMCLDSSLLGSSIHGILQAKILKRVAMPSSRDSRILSCTFYLIYRVAWITDNNWCTHKQAQIRSKARGLLYFLVSEA